jgi:hypothetical protein
MNPKFKVQTFGSIGYINLQLLIGRNKFPEPLQAVHLSIVQNLMFRNDLQCWGRAVLGSWRFFNILPVTEFRSQIKVISDGWPQKFSPFKFPKVFLVLVQHTHSSHGEVVVDFHARQQRESEKEACNATQRHHQVHPTEKDFAFVLDYGPGQEFDVYE